MARCRRCKCAFPAKQLTRQKICIYCAQEQYGAYREVYEEAKQKPRKSGRGWLIVLIIVVCALFASVSNRGDTNTAAPTAKATSTPKITSTPKPTKTPKPTATPTPSPTPTPAFAQMDAVEAARILADYYRDDMTITEVKQTGEHLRITLHSGPYPSAKYFIRTRCRVMVNVAKSLFANENFTSLTIEFTVPGYDKYGNAKTITAMTITLYRETAEKINFEYMYNSLGSTTKRFLQITDAYYVHPDLTEGVY